MSMYSSSSSSSSSSLALSRRRRSHSAASPSSSPAPAAPWRPPHKRAHSSHRNTPTLPDSQRCHLDLWRTGKRPRRGVSPTHATRSSTPATSSSSSAPHTPLFPASPADFLLFPSHPLYRGNLATRDHHSPSSAASLLHGDSYDSSKSELTRLRSAAFSELQRSVQENGEGFVKRMREFEDSRSRSGQHSRARGTERRRKKRFSPGIPNNDTSTTGKSIASDDDDDVLIFSSSLGAESIHPRQKRSSSLGAMDDGDFQLPGESNSFEQLSPISSIFHPLSFAHYASHLHPNTNQPTELSTSFSTSFDFTRPLHTIAFKSTSSYSSSDSLISWAEDANYAPSSRMVSPPQSPNRQSPGAILPSASNAEKAIAAITLAMANGAGGLGDYEAVRALDIPSTDESQVGELWH